MTGAVLVKVDRPQRQLVLPDHGPAKAGDPLSTSEAPASATTIALNLVPLFIARVSGAICGAPVGQIMEAGRRM
jgi:hypothetical protein